MLFLRGQLLPAIRGVMFLRDSRYTTRHSMTSLYRERRQSQIVTALCCWLLAFPSAVYAKSDIDRFELVGPVQSVVTKYPQLRTTQQFDRRGELTNLELVPTNETDSARYLFIHDEAGRVIEEQTFEPDGTLTYRKLFRYGADEQGRQTAQVAAMEKGDLAHAEFAIYDDRGHLAEELTVTGQGAAEKSLYDVRGNLIYHARYFEGRLMQESTHYHSPLGRLKESRFYAPDGELMRKDLYGYNQAGQRVEQQSEFYHHSHLRRAVFTYEFDHVGNWIKETVQRWSDKNGSVAPVETVVNRERIITYY